MMLLFKAQRLRFKVSDKNLDFETRPRAVRRRIEECQRQQVADKASQAAQKDPEARRFGCFGLGVLGFGLGLETRNLEPETA
jgi:hypothetical protein